MSEDTLNMIGVLTRREIEARIIAPLLEAFSDEMGGKRVLEITQQVIQRVAREQGEALARLAGGCTLAHFARSLEAWERGDARQTSIVEENEKRLVFNVRRCRYAEMYTELGIPELGKILSCTRDFTLIEGFNPDIHLTRTQTIMEGAAYCDFDYEVRKAGQG